MDERIIKALEDSGIKIKEWEGRETRYYLQQDGRDLGYLVDEDDGSTGTCRHLTGRKGWVASIIRKGLEA